ncbi:hypothetical protein FOCC_FOCC007308 [Frankliniella occidentalis]|nr:hypothetical protein FOCC_FOCC007308 [Frankliniella occidentalis]
MQEVIRGAKKIGNRAAGLKQGVDECCVRKWRRNKLKLSACPKKTRAFRGRKSSSPDLEKTLSDFRLCSRWTSPANKKKPFRSFEASRWLQKFMVRHGFSLHRRTSICQKLPADFEEKLVAFQRFVITLRKEIDYLLGQIGNADETPIWFDLPANYTITEKGDKQVVLKSTGGEKQRITAMLAITADSHLGTKMVVIPGGMTSVLQTLDVSVNKPFKAAVRDRCEEP